MVSVLCEARFHSVATNRGVLKAVLPVLQGDVPNQHNMPLRVLLHGATVPQRVDASSIELVSGRVLIVLPRSFVSL